VSWLSPSVTVTGVKPITLYEHVANKNALFDGIVDLRPPGTRSNSNRSIASARLISRIDESWGARILPVRQYHS
jgi:hypothetical protein